jgi:hypothetical protein
MGAHAEPSKFHLSQNFDLLNAFIEIQRTLLADGAPQNALQTAHKTHRTSTIMSLKTLVNDAGLSLDEIVNVSKDEFQEWAKVACTNDIVRRASIYSEWKAARNETVGAIKSLHTLCEQAGATMREVVALSSEDFRQLTKVLGVSGITLHTLLFQEKKRLLETMTIGEMTGLSAVGPMLDIATPRKMETVSPEQERRIVSVEKIYADARNDESSRDQIGPSVVMDDVRQQGQRHMNGVEVELLNRFVSAHDENSLLNDVLMCSHNIDPTGNGQLSLEFVWQLANTQKRAADVIPENQVIFSGKPKIGTRRYTKFVESFRSLYFVSSEEDRQVLAGLLVLVAQTRGYRFLRMDNDVRGLVQASDEFAKEQTMKILLPPAAKSQPSPHNDRNYAVRYARGQTKFTDEEDALIMEMVMSSPEHPFTSWARLTEKLPQYKSKQIRDRWINHLNPNIIHSPFTDEDVSYEYPAYCMILLLLSFNETHLLTLLLPCKMQDTKLYEGIKKYGARWAEISAQVFNSTRPENQVKNRRNSAAFRKFVVKTYGQEAFDAVGIVRGGSKRKDAGDAGSDASKKAKTA